MKRYSLIFIGAIACALLWMNSNSLSAMETDSIKSDTIYNEDSSKVTITYTITKIETVKEGDVNNHAEESALSVSDIVLTIVNVLAYLCLLLVVVYLVYRFLLKKGIIKQSDKEDNQPKDASVPQDFKSQIQPLVEKFMEEVNKANKEIQNKKETEKGAESKTENKENKGSGENPENKETEDPESTTENDKRKNVIASENKDVDKVEKEPKKKTDDDTEVSAKDETREKTKEEKKNGTERSSAGNEGEKSPKSEVLPKTSEKEPEDDKKNLLACLLTGIDELHQKEIIAKNKELAEKSAQFEQEKEGLKAKGKKEIEENENKHKAEIEKINKSHTDEIKKKEGEWKTKLEEQKKAAETKTQEQKAAFEKEKKDLKDKLASVEGEWKTKLEEQKKAAETKTQEQKAAFEKEKNDLKDKLTSVESEWKTKLEKQEKTYTQREESMKHSHAEQMKQLNEKHQKEAEQLETSHQTQLANEKKKTQEYRQYAEFVVSPRQQILDYAHKAVELIQLVQDARLKALDFERKNLFADDNVSYFYQKSINKFIKTTSSKTIEGWISELPQFARTGMYSTDNSSLLRSVFSDKKTAADQLNNMKYRLHHDLMTEYGSAALILLQELSSLEQLSGTRVDSTVIKYFKETLKIVMKKLVDLEYQIVYVELFSKFRGSDDFKSVRSVEVDAFEHEVVLEVQKMAIRYRGTKDKTEVIINR